MKYMARLLNRNGFTLVELLVSSIIIVLSIVAIVAMLRKGREIDINDKYRRKARTIVMSEFEAPKFHYSRYPNLVTGTTTRTDTIDARKSASPILGTLTTIIGAVDSTTASNGYRIAYRPVTMSIVWSTVDGSDTITLTKRITRAE